MAPESHRQDHYEVEETAGVRCTDCRARVFDAVLVNSAGHPVDVVFLDFTPHREGPYRIRWFFRWGRLPRRLAVRRTEWLERLDGRAYAWAEHDCYQPDRSTDGSA